VIAYRRTHLQKRCQETVSLLSSLAASGHRLPTRRRETRSATSSSDSHISFSSTGPPRNSPYTRETYLVRALRGRIHHHVCFIDRTVIAPFDTALYGCRSVDSRKGVLLYRTRFKASASYTPGPLYHPECQASSSPSRRHETEHSAQQPSSHAIRTRVEQGLFR
jgi:hypothetical protein